MKHLEVRELVRCGIFIALITVGSWIRIPVGPDVYTLQFLFTLLAGLVLGARLGAIAVGAYVLLGLVGVPVFAMGGGPGYLFQPTFGYLLGFIVQAYFCGRWARQTAEPGVRRLLLVNLGGMAIVYGIGISWFYLASNYLLEAPIALWTAILYCGILQTPPDLLICGAAAWLAVRFRRAGAWQSVPAHVQVKEV